MGKKSRTPFHLVLLGQIAAGKDTQAEILQKKYEFYPVESGKYWRALSESKTKEGEMLRKTTAKGKPAPVALMKKFITDSISQAPKTKSILFVGNPRLKPEAQLLLKILKERKENVRVVYISLPDKEVYARSLKRVRNEDDRKYVATRIKWHKDQVSKTVDYFNSKKLLTKINGNQTIEKVTEDIEKMLKKQTA